jgi:hypothetical protein
MHANVFSTHLAQQALMLIPAILPELLRQCKEKRRALSRSPVVVLAILLIPHLASQVTVH